MYRLILVAILILAVVFADGAEPTAEMRSNIYILSKMYGIEQELIYAIVKTESNFDIKAIGKTHKERGLMQLHPKYFPTASFDVVKNLRQGVKYLARLREVCYTRYGDAWFICYNTGPNTKVKNPFKLKYYKKVMYAKKQIEAQIHARSVAQSAD